MQGSWFTDFYLWCAEECACLKALRNLERSYRYNVILCGVMKQNQLNLTGVWVTSCGTAFTGRNGPLFIKVCHLISQIISTLVESVLTKIFGPRRGVDRWRRKLCVGFWNL